MCVVILGSCWGLRLLTSTRACPQLQGVLLDDAALLSNPPPGGGRGEGAGLPGFISDFVTFSPIYCMSVFLLCSLGDVLDCLLILLFIMF